MNNKLELKKAILELSYKENFKDLFLLASGKKSPYYFDLKQVLFIPKYLSIACSLIYNKIHNFNTQTHALAGLTMGADPLIYGTSLLAHSSNIEWSPIIGRKKTKDHGTKNKLEGQLTSLNQQSNIVLIDDVITTGKSTLEVAHALLNLDFKPITAICIVDREEGGKENLAKEGITLFPLFTLTDFSS